MKAISQSLIVARNNPRVTGRLVNFGFTSMAFKDYLRDKLAEKELRPAELARLAGVTKQNIGRILNDTRHPISGGLPKVTIETVDKLAKGLGVPLDEARLAAGYAPTSMAESHDILDTVTISFKPGQNFTEEEKEQFLRDVRHKVLGMKAEREGGD